MPSAKKTPPIRVLLVDDHPLWRDTLRKVLERKGFATVVAEAGDAAEALAAARACTPDVVVMDIQLPGETGIDATRTLVAERSNAKVLVLASSDQRAQVVAAVEAGARGYLIKTAGSDEVRESVRRVNDGEMVFPPALASVVLQRLRGETAEPPAPATDGSIRLEGEYWTIEFEGDLFRLKDTRGVRFLAQLLKNPGREFHAMDLVSADRTTAGLTGAQDAGPALDPQAKKAYRQRLADLEDELREAQDWGDIGRAGRITEEIEAIRSQLSAAVGLGGRDRKAASGSERARVNVTLAIRSTLAKIAGYSSALSDHLETTIRTGTFCAYLPDPQAGRRWR